MDIPNTILFNSLSAEAALERRRLEVLNPNADDTWLSLQAKENTSARFHKCPLCRGDVQVNGWIQHCMNAECQAITATAIE